MRIKSKWLKKRKHAWQIRIPAAVKSQFKKEIIHGDVPTNQQIKSAMALGVVDKDENGKPNTKSLAAYFKTFINQRRADDQRHV